MGSSQIVFLFDLHAYNNELSDFGESLNEKVFCLRLACLRFLTEFATKTSNLRWGCKFFDSFGPVTQEMPKMTFSDFTLESFETFENEICVKYERYSSFCKALVESRLSNICPTDSNDATHSKKVLKKGNHQIAPVKILQLAVMQLLSEFHWEHPDIWSPSTKHVKANCLGKRNILVHFGEFPDNEKQLLTYFGLDDVVSKIKLANVIIPRTFGEKFLEKADIQWIWINAAKNLKFMGSPSSKTLQLLSKILKTIRSSLIPLSLLSQSVYQIRLLSCQNYDDAKSRISEASTSNQVLNSCLLPFSTVLYQSLHYPFYSDVDECSMFNSSLLFCDAIEISLQLMEILNCNDNGIQEGTGSKTATFASASPPTAGWSKIVIQGFVSKNAKCTLHSNFMCFPDESSLEEFSILVKTLLLQDKNLVVTCLTENGLQIPSLFVPLTLDVAVLSTIDALPEFSDASKLEKYFPSSKNRKVKDIAEKTQNFKAEFEGAHFSGDSSPNLSTGLVLGSSLKQFPVESLEHWFQSSCAAADLSNLLTNQRNNLSREQSFHKLLKQSASGKKPPSEEPANELVKQTLATSQAYMVSEENYEDLSFDELRLACQKTYNNALETSSSMLESAKKITGLVSNFYKKHGGPDFEDNVLIFMKNNILLTARRISEKYELTESGDNSEKKTKECQLQVLLALEIEALTLPPDKSDCVKNVTAILRMMSFYTGPVQLNKLLFEILRENYSNKLYDVLVDIGDELDMPLFGDEEPSESPNTVSSELMDGEMMGSVVSSDVSTKSSSSMCNKKDNPRKLNRYRSDISDSAISRQILLPGTSPKKKSKSSAPKKAVRCSPRLASRKTEKLTKSKEEKPKHVCRNLFPKEKGPQTPKKSRCATPKSKKKKTCIKVCSRDSQSQTTSFCLAKKEILC